MTAVPPDLVELGKACLAHDRLARPSAAAAVTQLRNILVGLEAGSSDVAQPVHN